MKSTHGSRKTVSSSANPEKGNTHATWPATNKGGSSTAKINPPISSK